MIRAELTDGKILEFPDGTAQSVIDGVVKRTVGERPIAPAKTSEISETTDLSQNFQDLIREGVFSVPEKAEDSVRLAATYNLLPSQAYRSYDALKKEMEKRNISVGKSFISGVGDVYETAGSALKWMGFDEQAETYGDFGKRLKKAYSYEMKPEEFTWRRVMEPEWWATSVARSVPFTLSLIPASILAAYGGATTATAVGFGAFGRLVLGAIGGAAVSRPLESALEAGATYQQEIDKGKNEAEAEEAANYVFKGNLALTGMDAVEFATAFTPLKMLGNSATKSLARRILATGGKLGVVGGLEAGEEGYQEALQRLGAGEEVKFDPSMKEAMTIGGIFGVGLGGTGSVYTALRDRVIKDMPAEMKQELDNLEKEAVSEGLSQQEAELKALDTVAETPEGKTHIENVIENLKDPTKPKVKKPIPEVKEEVKVQPEPSGEAVGVKEPWEMTREEFEKAPPDGFAFNANLKYEADAHTNSIRIGPKFFELPQEAREGVIRHELAHGFEDRAVRSADFYDLIQKKQMFGPLDENGKIVRGINGQYKPGENLVEAYVMLFEDPKWLKKNYPIAYEYVIKEAKTQGKPVPKEVLKDYPDLTPKKTEKVQPEPSGEATEPLIEEAKKYKTAEEFVESQGEEVYHGSPVEWEGDFDVSKLGETTKARTAQLGAFFSSDPAIAQSFAGFRSGRDIKKVRVKLENPIHIESSFEFRKPISGLIDAPSKITNPKDPRVLKGELGIPKIKKDAFVDFWENIGFSLGKPKKQITPQDIREWVKGRQSAGYDGIVFHNTKMDMQGNLADQYVVFDPKNLKTTSQLTDIWNKAHVKTAKPIERKVAKEQPPLPTEEPVTEYERGELNKIDEQITAQASRQAEINVYQRLEKTKAKNERKVQKMAQVDIADIPVYKAMAEIKSRGGLNLKKLSKDYPMEDRRALTRKYPGLISKTGRVALDEIADELGYETDTDLMNEMLEAPTQKEAVQKYVDDFYNRYYDEAMGEGEDVLSMLFAEESRLLKEATKKYKIKPAKGLKKFIREETGQVKVKEIIEVKHGEILEYAMKEAQKAARIAYRTGNKEGIAKAKTKYRETLEKKRVAIQAREYIKKMVYDLKKIDIEKLAPYQSEVVKSLLSGLDLTRPMKKTILKLSKTREYLEGNPEAEIPDYVMERLARLDQKNLHDLTLDELESIHDAVMHQAHLSKLKNKIKVRRKLQEEAEVLSDSVTEMKPREELKTSIVNSQQGGIGARKNAGELIKDTFGIRHDHYDLIIESLAGPNSTMDKVLYQEVKEGVIKQLKYRQDFYNKYKTEVDKIGIKDISAWLTEEIKTGKFKLTRNERMALYEHSQNTDNRRAIIEGGFGFRTSPDPNAVHKMTEAELNDIIGSLTKEERSFADIWDELSEEQYTSLNKVFLEKNGYNLPKEESYYPKATMPLARGKDFESEEALEKLKGKWTRIGIEKGMLEKRRRVKLPIYLNSFTYDINKSLMKSAAYIGLELPLSNASKLLYNKDFRRELSERYGKQTWIEIEKGLRDIAGDWQSYTTVEEIALKLKNNLTTAILGVNPFVMAKQVLSLPVYLPYVKSEYIVQGFMDYMGDPNSVTGRHDMYSPEWVERMEGGYSRDVADIFKGAGEKRFYGGEASVKEKIMGGIKLFDKYAVASGMQGAVLQVLDEFKAGEMSKEVSVALDMVDTDIAGLTPEDKMRLAYRYADFATERTQPMFSPEHRSSLSRGSTIEKLATMFGSFTNQALNLVRRTSREGARTGNYESLATALFAVFIVNTLGVMAIDEIRDRIFQRDSGSLPGRILNSWAGYVFFLRDLASSVISKVERGTFMGYDVSWPITRVPQLMSDVMANGVAMMTEKNKVKREKAAKRFVDDSLNLLLMLNGIPYETPKKLGKAALEAAK